MCIPSDIAPAPLKQPVTEKSCRCRKSKCLKLYCECFASSQLCSLVCKCMACENTKECAEERQQVKQAMMARSRNAFRSAPLGPDMSSYAHLRGCNCRRSECRKKYCECFNAGMECTAACRCTDCVNDGRLNHLRDSCLHEWTLPHAVESTSSALGVESVLFLPSINKRGSKRALEEARFSTEPEMQPPAFNHPRSIGWGLQDRLGGVSFKVNVPMYTYNRQTAYFRNPSVQGNQVQMAAGPIQSTAPIMRMPGLQNPSASVVHLSPTEYRAPDSPTLGGAANLYRMAHSARQNIPE
eukprot:TRINITY_DN567_c0_g1_i2.p1 TRINITY_DN567_c0_g1~~TRINITY_DN567_c0_g1_i2.p1  ORF type:complete len:297 (-),score=25.62 TRINITY_DN567_c0_g1_i2:55-945(-)